MMSLPHLSRAHPLLLSSAWCCFAAQVGSSHLIHSQLLLCSAVSDSDLIACRSVCPQTPTSFRSLPVQVPAKPLQPTPTVKNCVLQACCAAPAAMSAYWFTLMPHPRLPLMDRLVPQSSDISGRWATGSWSESRNHLRSRSFGIFQSAAMGSWSLLTVGFVGNGPGWIECSIFSWLPQLLLAVAGSTVAVLQGVETSNMLVLQSVEMYKFDSWKGNFISLCSNAKRFCNSFGEHFTSKLISTPQTNNRLSRDNRS